jgi:hypothetical protein
MIMNLSNPLPTVRETYEASRDALIITKKVITHNDKETLLFHTTFGSKNTTDAKKTIENSLKEQEDLFVLSLWSKFERFIRDYLQQKGATLQTTQPTALAYPMYQYFCDEVEFWKPHQMLDLLKKTLFTTHPHLIGQAKQVLEYRDWVAHGKNPNKHPSSTVKAKFAYNTLNYIVETLLLN